MTSKFPTSPTATYVVYDNDQWAAARRHARTGDRIIVITKHIGAPRGTRGLRYTVTGVGRGMTGPEPVARPDARSGSWSPVVPTS